MDVSIIIVNYNTKELIIECLKSIYLKTELVAYEIIVVDNASVDGSVEVLSELFPDIIFVRNEKNIGFGRANNEGVKVSKGEYLFFLNPDTILLNNAIGILVDFLRKNPLIAICGGNLYDVNMNLSHSYSLFFPSLFWEFNLLLGGKLAKMKYGCLADKNETNASIDVAYITGADMLIRKDLFVGFGGFSSDFFMYYEETELTYRIKQQGFHIVNIPQAKIMHLEGASFDVSEFRLKQMFIGRHTFYNKIYDDFYVKCVDIIFLLTCWSRILIFRFLNKSKYKYWSTMLSAFLFVYRKCKTS